MSKIEKVKLFSGYNDTLTQMNTNIEKFIDECNNKGFNVKVENSYGGNSGNGSNAYTYVLLSAYKD